MAASRALRLVKLRPSRKWRTDWAQADAVRMIDPGENGVNAEATHAVKGEKKNHGAAIYVTSDPIGHRSRDNARCQGFISGDSGSWYSRSSSCSPVNACVARF
jgi:hypothetical protein